MKRSRGMAPRSNAVHVIRSMQCCTQSPHQSDKKTPRPPVERSSGARPHVRFQQGAAPTHSRVAPRRRAPPSASDRVTRRPRTGWLRVWRYSVPLVAAVFGKVGVGHDLNFGYVVLAHRSVRAEASPLGLEAEAGPRRRGRGPGGLVELFRAAPKRGAEIRRWCYALAGLSGRIGGYVAG